MNANPEESAEQSKWQIKKQKILKFFFSVLAGMLFLFIGSIGLYTSIENIRALSFDTLGRNSFFEILDFLAIVQSMKRNIESPAIVQMKSVPKNLSSNGTLAELGIYGDIQNIFGDSEANYPQKILRFFSESSLT